MSQAPASSKKPKGIEPPACQAPSACGGGCRFFHHDAGILDALKNGPVIRLARKRTIFSTGDDAHHVYKVLDGAVRVSRLLLDGHRQILDICLPGDAFGLEAGETYGATAEAIGEAIVLRCPRVCVAQQNAERPETNREVFAMLSRGLNAAQDHLVMLGHKGARQRVASFLMRLANSREGAGPTLDLPVGRQDLADYLGLTIETTSRVLSDLKASRVISTPNRRQIFVRDAGALERAAEGDG